MSKIKTERTINGLKFFSEGTVDAKIIIARQEERQKIFAELDKLAKENSNPCMKCGSIQCAICYDDFKKLKKEVDYMKNKKIRIDSVEPIEGTIIDHFKTIDNIKDAESIF